MKSFTERVAPGGIGSLFQPDTLLGEDYAANFRRKLPLEPERTLLLAILEDAVSCFQKYAGATGQRGRRLFQEAEEWFSGADEAWVFGVQRKLYQQSKAKPTTRGGTYGVGLLTTA